MTPTKPTVTLHHKGKIVTKNPEIEWYSGNELYTNPIRIKIRDIWEQVFTFEKQIQEDSLGQQRKIIFRCHIGDNRIIVVIVTTNISHKG